MRYPLDNMDYYHLMAIGTRVECVPLIQLILDEPIDQYRLKVASEHALVQYPLLKTRIVFEREYFFEENDNEIILHNCPIDHRPRSFGENANGYPWQICFYENQLCFEWCHAVTDGRGGLAFLAAILAAYFHVPSDVNHCGSVLPFKQYYSRKATLPRMPKQPLGYSNRNVKAPNRGSLCASHRYSISSLELMNIAHQYDATPVALIAPLFSRALHDCLPARLRKENIRMSINIDTRVPMGIETMHNAALFEPFTYMPAHDEMDIRQLCSSYRKLLDGYRQPEYIIARCTSLIDQTDDAYRMHFLSLNKRTMRIAAWWLKEHDTNAQLSYLGLLPFHPDVLKRVRDCWFYMWPDVGYCNLNMIDCNGKFNMNICENFADAQLVEKTMITLGDDCGLRFVKEGETVFQQAQMRI